MKKIADLNELEELLGIKVKQLAYLAHNIKSNVRTSQKPKTSQPGKVRTITAPSDKLKHVQRQIKICILDDYPYPSYCYGLGGNTLKQHSQVHGGRNTTVQVDLRDFYPSIKHELVYSMWIQKFGYSHEVARILTKLTTLNGCLQQGFPTSSHVAAIVAEDYTGSINEYCRANRLVFTQYVDDLNISGKNIDQRVLFKTIIPMGRKYGLAIKKSKTKVNGAGKGKEVTGVAVFGNKTRAARRIRQKAIRALKDYSASPEDTLAKRRVAGYRGFLRHINKQDGDKYTHLRDSVGGQSVVQ